MKIYRNFIANEFVLEGDRFSNVLNPANGSTIAKISMATHEEINQACESARIAQKKWSKLSCVERASNLKIFADKIYENREEIGSVLSEESGKSLEDAISEVTYGVDILRYHSEWARRIEGEVLQSDNPNETMILQRISLGVIACLIPFNYPIYILLRKIAPALITGNTVVVRLSNHTPCSSMVLANAIIESGIPAGVINILCMDHDSAETLCTNRSIEMITLTGGLKAGQIILKHSAKNIAKVSLELGGKTPAIILEDSQQKKAAKEIIQSSFTHCGQLCTAVERVYVHEKIYEPFLELLKKEIKELSFGDRKLNPNHMGPLISESARDVVHRKISQAISQGAKLETGGFIPKAEGYFYPPSLLSECRQDMDIIQKDVFGPVLCVVKCSDGNEALKYANDHELGLAAVLYTNNHTTALKFSNHIEAGELYINRAPGEPYQGYHAGMKRSGIGGDDGKHGMLEFTQTRLVVMSY